MHCYRSSRDPEQWPSSGQMRHGVKQGAQESAPWVSVPLAVADQHCLRCCSCSFVPAVVASRVPSHCDSRASPVLARGNQRADHHLERLCQSPTRRMRANLEDCFCCRCPA